MLHYGRENKLAGDTNNVRGLKILGNALKYENTHGNMSNTDFLQVELAIL